MKLEKLKYIENRKIVEYKDPLQIAELFYQENLANTIYNLMTDVVNFSIDQENKDGKAFPMILMVDIAGYEAFNLEYNLLVSALSKNFEEHSRRKFMVNFALREGIRDNMKYPMFLMKILDDYLGLVAGGKPFMPKGSGVISSNFYRPIVYENTEFGEAAQMSAITFRIRVLEDILSELSVSHKLLESLEYFYGKYLHYRQVAFGSLACKKYWIEKRKHKVIMFKI